MNSSPIHLVQVSIHVPNSVRHLKPFFSRTAIDDDTLVLKTALTEAFGGALVRPWSLHAQRGPIAMIIGYSATPADELNRRRSLALPSVQMAVGEALSIIMPPLNAGERFRFAVKLVPTIRVTATGDRRHEERDAFLVAADKAGVGAGLKRDDVYPAYLREKLTGVEVDHCRLVQFQLRGLVRPKEKAGHGLKTFPEASLMGELTVNDPQSFSKALATGIGRQRAYGYGMLRLEPVPMIA